MSQNRNRLRLSKRKKTKVFRCFGFVPMFCSSFIFKVCKLEIISLLSEPLTVAQIRKRLRFCSKWQARANLPPLWFRTAADKITAPELAPESCTKMLDNSYYCGRMKVQKGVTSPYRRLRPQIMDSLKNSRPSFADVGRLFLFIWQNRYNSRNNS